MQHITVLEEEAVTGLALDPASIVIDATLGAGGHARKIASVLGPEGRLIAIDVDPEAIVAASNTALLTKASVTLVEGNFRSLAAIAADHGLTTVEAILADLGWRTDQFTSIGRGFSFTDDQGLAMTFGAPSQYSFTAYEIINEWSEETLANIIYGYGEERQARKIARAIVEARNKSAILTAKQLADVVQAAVKAPPYARRIHPATKTFQAIRIAVNDELKALEEFIAAAFDLLAPSGRLAIISFHSLEDRIVKHSFRSFTHDHVGELVTKKPITPSPEECRVNPRARSAKLRIIKKL